MNIPIYVVTRIEKTDAGDFQHIEYVSVDVNKVVEFMSTTKSHYYTSYDVNIWIGDKSHWVPTLNGAFV